MEGAVKHLRNILPISVTTLSLLFAIPIATQAQTQMSNVKHVFIILMENHNWTGDNSGASFGDPDIKGSLLAPYIRTPVSDLAAVVDRLLRRVVLAIW